MPEELNEQLFTGHEFAVEVRFTFLSENGEPPDLQEIYRHLTLAISDPHKVTTHAPTDRNETTEDLLYVRVTPL